MQQGDKALWIFVLMGVILALFPLYGGYIGNAVFGSEEYGSVSGQVERVGVNYITIHGKTVYVKGNWEYRGKSYTSEELLQFIHPGENLNVYYTTNPRWGATAEKIIFEDGSTATKEEG